MEEYVFVVFTKPVTDREDEYNDWYNNVHLGDVTSLPGFVRAQRFRLDDSSRFGYRYLALYEIKTADVTAVMETLSRAGETMRISPALDKSDVLQLLFKAISPKVGAHDGLRVTDE